MPKIEQCLNCLDFPCTCGEQYKNLEDKQLAEVIASVQDILINRGYNITSCRINEQNIRAFAIEKGKDPVPLFTKYDIEKFDETLPSKWVVMLKTETSLSVLWKKLETVDPDDVPLPGLFMFYLFLKYIDVIDIFKTGQRFYQLYNDVIEALLAHTAIKEFLDAAPANLDERIAMMKSYNFVNNFDNVHESLGKIAHCIYITYLKIHDMNDKFDSLLNSMLTTIATIRQLPLNIDNLGWTPRYMVSKFSEELYYYDAEIKKVMIRQFSQHKLMIDKLI